MARPIQLPDKLFFRIGEVAEIVGVRPHVLRYWEEEFGILKPMKTRGAHRQYRRRDVELALVIKRLLHDEGFTVAGARKRLREMGHAVRAEFARNSPVPAARGGRELELRAELLAVRAELAAWLATIEHSAAGPAGGRGGSSAGACGATSAGATSPGTTGAGACGATSAGATSAGAASPGTTRATGRAPRPSS
jgi:DNA-binding transcriptional MerR regulator